MKNFFVLIWNWITSFFVKKEEPVEVEVKPPERKVEIIKKPKIKSIGFRAHVQHNNRKRTRGRIFQIVTVGNTSKIIHHSTIN